MYMYFLSKAELAMVNGGGVATAGAVGAGAGVAITRTLSGAIAADAAEGAEAGSVGGVGGMLLGAAIGATAGIIVYEMFD